MAKLLSRRRMLASLLLLLIHAGHAAGAEESQRGPGWPVQLEWGLEHRTRYETLTRQFRSNGRGGDQVLALRTLLRGELQGESWRAGAELADSRIALDDAGTPVNNSQVNELELLQAYVAWRGRAWLFPGGETGLKVGRQTLDVGSRRLIARNRFRNTINSFTGIDLSTMLPGDAVLRGFFVLPVDRLPAARADIDRHDVEFDDESGDVYLAGLFYSTPRILPGAELELYVYYLHESDSGETPSRNRRLLTPGFRVFTKPARGAFDLELEAVGQWGHSRASTAPADRRDLDHGAFLVHAQLGYSLDAPLSPRFLLQYDYASGDGDPLDDEQGTFDTLYGARRSEFGPTGIWGPFARANVSTPGYRLELKPAASIKAMLAHRWYWLADERGPWSAAQVHDPSGASGSYLGHQLEARLQWDAKPDRLELEAGWAHFFRAGFSERAPGVPGLGDLDYFYTQMTLYFP